jgi:hypothetical protein
MRRPRAMNTYLVRYGAGAVLAVAAAGLLVSSAVAHAAPAGSASVRPQSPHGGATGCVSPASVRARGELINAGECTGTTGSPGRVTGTHPAGRRGQVVLDPKGRACPATHPERRELARSCPVATVIGFP